MKQIAIAYSPRGFRNESSVVVVPADKVAATKNKINNDVNAFVFTGKVAARIKRQWKRDIANGERIETEIWLG